MKPYQVRSTPLSGTSGTEIRKRAELIMRAERARTKRQPYIRSAYFNKDKVFIQLFWQHTWDKHFRERARRLKFLPCALELLRHSRITPVTRQSNEEADVLLHRFEGISPEGQLFVVQVRENKKTDRKDFMSVFPKA